MKNGLSENESSANQKLSLVARYLIEKTKYKPSVVKNNLKRYAKKYFEGLSEDIINSEIELIYNYAKNELEKKNKSKKKVDVKKISDNTKKDIDDLKKSKQEDDDTGERKDFEFKELTLYNSEMERISELDEELQELAFAFLIVNKYQSYIWIDECNADIYKICHWDEKGNGKSQTTKDKLIHRLVEEKIISFYCKTNKAYCYNKSWIAKTIFTVLINEDNHKDKNHSMVWKKITNYDDVMLYWRLYKGDLAIKLCEKCNAPIIDTGNSKKFCSDCALERIRKSKKRSKKKALKFAS